MVQFHCLASIHSNTVAVSQQVSGFGWKRAKRQYLIQGGNAFLSPSPERSPGQCPALLSTESQHGPKKALKGSLEKWTRQHYVNCIILLALCGQLNLINT